MHLFLFDIFISVDILCPIINALNKKKKNFSLFSKSYPKFSERCII